MLNTSVVGWLSQFTRDRRGVSAVEFAFVAPIMVALYLGCSEIADGVAADRKVSLIAGALANLAASCSDSNANSGSCAANTNPPYNISTTEMDNMLDASSAIIAPYNASKLTMTVSCIKIDGNGAAKVQWSASRHGTARTAGSVYTFSTSASALNVKNSWLLLSEVTYAYTPTVGYTITGTLTLSDQMFMAPRISAPAYNNTTCT
jgi:Flp pilus assembly protein TadG